MHVIISICRVIAGEDFEPLDIHVPVLLAVEEPSCVNISIFLDNVVEDDEEFNVLILPNDGVISIQPAATVTIKGTRKLNVFL